MSLKLGVVGIAGGHFFPTALPLLQSAARIYGAPAALAALPPALAGERLPLDAAVLRQLPEIVRAAATLPTVLLASGDPLCCGLGGTLRRYAGPEALTIIPAPTAFQQFFARLGMPWEKLRFFSVHGQTAPLPWRSILQAELAVVYGDRERPARQLAAELIAAWPAAAARLAACGCDLGRPEEYLRQGSLREIAADARADASLSLLALLPDDAFGPPVLPLGLPDGDYLHYKNMITHPEVRAVVLSKLRLRPGVLWDLGAGSGSVGLEAAQLCPGLEVYAVEKQADRCAEIRANYAAAGVAAWQLREGDAGALLDELPPPDRIFLGGGGGDLAKLLQRAFDRLKPGGVMAATGVLVESVAVLCTVLPAARRELLSFNLSRAEALGKGHCFKAENPITIAVWQKEATR